MNIRDREIQRIIEKTDWAKLDGSAVLVTGATGLIGSMITKALIERNINVIAMVRDENKAARMLGTSPQYYVHDIEQPAEINEDIDYIVHTASPTASKYFIEHPVETFSVAVNGTRNMLELAREKQVKGFVYLSSMEVYGTTAESQNPVTEEKLGFIRLDEPRSSYPEGKRACELLCNLYFTEYGVPAKVARLANTFGPGVPKTDNRFFMQLAKAAVNKENIVLHTAGNSTSNFCYITDTVCGILKMLTDGKPGESYNVCNDTETRRIKEIAELVCKEVANGEIEVKYEIPEGNKFGYAKDTALRLSSEKLKLLGWNPEIGMKEAYAKLVEYLMAKE